MSTLIRFLAWGRNDYGQLGDDTTGNKTTPVPVKGPDGEGYLTDVVAIAAGGNHSLALKSDGTVWAWGGNDYGQLGDGTTTGKFTPVQVKGPGGEGYLTDIIAIAAGGYHSLALKSDGTVWAWGYNGCGQLGNGTTINRTTPVQVKRPDGKDYLTDIIAIAAGTDSSTSTPWESFSLALKSDGTVLAWGGNDYGQLGDSTTEERHLPVQVKGPGGEGYLTDVIVIAAGERYSLALKSDGTVWGWGHNYGQLGVGSGIVWTTLPKQMKGPGGEGYLTDIIAIAAGGCHSLALKSDGTVWACGYNGYGQLGDGTTTGRVTPVQVKGPGGEGYLTDIIAIAAGTAHADDTYKTFSLALKSDGTVWACGYNGYGQLGDGTTTGRTTLVQVKGPGGEDYLGGITNIAAGMSYALAINTTQALIFTNAQGAMISKKDLGQLLAGTSISPVRVDLYNGINNAVTNVSVTRQNLPSDDTIEISATSDPFVAEDPLPLNGTFAPNEKIGTVYVRVNAPIKTSTGEPNEGIKNFTLYATGTPSSS